MVSCAMATCVGANETSYLDWRYGAFVTLFHCDRSGVGASWEHPRAVRGRVSYLGGPHGVWRRPLKAQNGIVCGVGQCLERALIGCLRARG